MSARAFHSIRDEVEGSGSGSSPRAPMAANWSARSQFSGPWEAMALIMSPRNGMPPKGSGGVGEPSSAMGSG